MEQYEPFLSFGVALAAGALLGMEREQSAPRREKDEGGIGGVRTYPIFSLLGGVAMLLSKQLGPWTMLVALLGVFGFLAVGYFHDVRDHHERGLTSEGAFLLAFSLGALALSDGVITPTPKKFVVVASIAVIATLFLSLKTSLHEFVGRVNKDDVFATLKFLIVAVVILPLLPNQTFGPLQVLNPFQIGVMVALIAGIGFVGYIAVRIVGAERGFALTGALGGLVSSTAVTLTFSGRAKETPVLRPSAALAVVLASTIMFPRLLVVVAALNRKLLTHLLPTLSAMFIAGVVFCAWLYIRTRKQPGQATVELRNPFELSQALKLAALFAVVLLISKAVSTYFGTGATYLTGFLAGLSDADPVALSMAKLSESGAISPHVASVTIVLGAVANTVVKAVMATVIGGWQFGRIVTLAFAVMLIVGAVVLTITLLV